jgi:DNA-binding CsgD family transcriptional regulator
LTSREIEVLKMLCTGASTKTIADVLGISPWTVKRHLTNLYQKVGAANRVDAVRHYLLSEQGGANRADPASPAMAGPAHRQRSARRRRPTTPA